MTRSPTKLGCRSNKGGSPRSNKQDARVGFEGGPRAHTTENMPEIYYGVALAASFPVLPYHRAILLVGCFKIDLPVKDLFYSSV